MNREYEIHSGRRIVSTQLAVSPLQAVVDYVRSSGVKDNEIRRLGVDSVSWRGAQFRAVLTLEESPALGGEALLASPELALVDAELAAELRRTLSPVQF